jgi:hypothetical protein
MYSAEDISMHKKMFKRQILIIETKTANLIFNIDLYFRFRFQEKITTLHYKCMIEI